MVVTLLWRGRHFAGLFGAATLVCAAVASAAIPTSENKPDFLRLADDLFVLRGAVNTGVLVHGRTAVLFDCCDSVTPERLAALGVDKVEAVYFTQFRRPNTAGGYTMAETGARLYGPAGERDCFEMANEYWADEHNHWSVYHFRPGLLVPCQSMKLAGTTRDGDRFDWNGHEVRVLGTPGMTDGAVSYLVQSGGRVWAFCGDVMSGPGQIWDIHSLQKAFPPLDDYHGFMGAREELLDSAEKLQEAAPAMLVPSHGDPFPANTAAFDTLRGRIAAVWKNFTAVSSFDVFRRTEGLNAAEDPRFSKREPFPEWIHKIAATTFAVASDAGTVLVVDFGTCSLPELLDQVDAWMDEKDTPVEMCWATHYHDDHAVMLYALSGMGVPIFSDLYTAAIVEEPERYFLPCQYKNAALVSHVMQEGETCAWREYTLTGFHFPGQTLYHGGLLLEGHGRRIFFAGDSFSPEGLDDYCPANRVFLGAGVGYRRCIEVLRSTHPDLILNQHQNEAFSFSEEQLDYMDAVLAEREGLVAAFTPWENPNFALDPYWARTTPYEQEVWPGQRFVLAVEFTNHGDTVAPAGAEVVLPGGWRAPEGARQAAMVPPKTCGIRIPSVPNPDSYIAVTLECPADAAPGLRVIPVRVWWRDQYLGQIVHALIRVRAGEAGARTPGRLAATTLALLAAGGAVLLLRRRRRRRAQQV